MTMTTRIGKMPRLSHIAECFCFNVLGVELMNQSPFALVIPKNYSPVREYQLHRP